MNTRTILVEVLLLAALLGAASCTHVPTSSSQATGTVQSFGCNGDLPSPYAPYCRPSH